MLMLNRNGMLDYAIIPPTTENEALCLQGENSFKQGELGNPQVMEIMADFINPWRKVQGQIVIMATCGHQHMVLLPLTWEGSIVKLLSEFVSLTNVIYDIPPMGAGAATSEIMRRCQFLLDAEIKNTKRNYSTPYCGFFHTHMTSFNSIVTSALATPAGVEIRMLVKEGLSPDNWEYQLQKTAGDAPIVALQWPFRLEFLRVLDSENQPFRFQMKDLQLSNAACSTPHINLAREGLFFYQAHEIPANAVADKIQSQFGGFRRRDIQHNLHNTIPKPPTDYEMLGSDRTVSLRSFSNESKTVKI